MKRAILLSMFFIMFYNVKLAADTNTVTSTITGTNTITGTTTIDKTPPTANAPNVIINNNDVCKSGYTAGLQSSVVGLATGVTVRDENCERIKLSRSLYAMGMMVAAVSALCQDERVFDAMMMAGTPCPYKGKIGDEALAAWKQNPQDVPKKSTSLKVNQTKKWKDPFRKKGVGYSAREVWEEGDDYMEPLSIGLALSVATKSYSMITKTIEAGAEFEQVMGQMSKWWGACQDINKANEVAKKPPLFKKLTFQDSQKEALDAFVAKKKMEEMRGEIRTMLLYRFGPEAWKELCQMEREIKQQRQDMIYAQKERIRKLFDGIIIVAGIIAIVGLIFGIIVLINSAS